MAKITLSDATKKLISKHLGLTFLADNIEKFYTSENGNIISMLLRFHANTEEQLIAVLEEILPAIQTDCPDINFESVKYVIITPEELLAGGEYVSEGEITLFGSDAELEAGANLKLVGSTVNVGNLKLTAQSQISLNGANGVKIANVTINGNQNNSNAQVLVKVGKKLVISNMTFDKTAGKNAIEIWENPDTKLDQIIIENCKFNAPIDNNAINIFSTNKNCEIIIKDCYFKSVSNAVRLSNAANASGVKVTFDNCVCEEWATGEYAGFLLLQDYTSTADNVVENNLFAPSKIAINFNNCVGPNGPIQFNEVSEVVPIEGEENPNQLVYLYTNAENAVIPFNAARYPKMQAN